MEIRTDREIIKRGAPTSKSCLSKAKSQSPQDKARIFANLIMNGQINSAVCFSTENGNNGILPLNTGAYNRPNIQKPKIQQIRLSHMGQ